MNEVEETLRVLNTQIKSFKKESDKLSEAFEEFEKQCKTLLDENYFIIVCNLFESAIGYYEACYEESVAVRKEILNKYNIPSEE